tara:strand:- start:616 stop:723 length:108 start_codon:yes stop_codon:yes gene_type:complete
MNKDNNNDQNNKWQYKTHNLFIIYLYKQDVNGGLF